MNRFGKSLFAILAFAMAAPLLAGCMGGGGVVYVRSPPPRRVVVVERRAHVWMPGHWVHHHHTGERVWISGYWR